MSGAPWVWPPINVNVSTTPPTTDTVTNASEVPGATLTDVLNTQYAPSLNAFVLNPLAPNVWDLFAALMTDPDLANNGWLVNDLGSGATVTRAGDVNRFGPRPAANTYESTLHNGLLFMRTPAAQTIAISKLAQSAVTGYTLRTHAWVTKQTANGSFASSAEAMVWSAGTSGLINGPVTFTAAQSQTNWCGCEDSRYVVNELVQGNFAVVHEQVDINQAQTNVVNYIHVAAAPSTQDLAYDSGEVTGFLQPGTPFSHTMTRARDRAGIFVGSGADGFVIIDSIRMLPYMTMP